MALVNVVQKERGANWSTMPLQVDGGWVEFPGRKVSQTIVEFQPCGAEAIERYFTLYETPDEGYRLCLVESLYSALDGIRRTSQRSAESRTIRVLYSEEEARRYYPAALGQLLRQKQIKEKFGL